MTQVNSYSKTWPVGTVVRAKCKIQEKDFPIKGNTHTHANAGDTGIIMFNDSDLVPTVRFDKTQTATIVCTSTEVEAVNGSAPSATEDMKNTFLVSKDLFY